MLFYVLGAIKCTLLLQAVSASVSKCNDTEAAARLPERCSVSDRGAFGSLACGASVPSIAEAQECAERQHYTGDPGTGMQPE